MPVVVQAPQINDPLGPLLQAQQQQNQLLMQKGQLALETEKFEAEDTERKAKRAAMDQYSQFINQKIAEQQQSGQQLRPEDAANLILQASGYLSRAGEPGEVQRALGALPQMFAQMQQEQRQQRILSAGHDLLTQAAAEGNLATDPNIQAKYIAKAMAVDPQLGKQFGDALKDINASRKDASGTWHYLMDQWSNTVWGWNDKTNETMQRQAGPSRTQVQNPQAAQKLQMAIQANRDLQQLYTLYTQDKDAIGTPPGTSFWGGAGSKLKAFIGGATTPLAQGMRSNNQASAQIIVQRLIPELVALNSPTGSMTGFGAQGVAQRMLETLMPPQGIGGLQPAAQRQVLNTLIQHGQTAEAMIDYARKNKGSLSGFDMTKAPYFAEMLGNEMMFQNMQTGGGAAGGSFDPSQIGKEPWTQQPQPQPQ